jgi:hypothetical protein
MDFNVYFPENHSAMLGAAKMAADLIPLANAQGFSPDICSYLTSDIGSYLKGVTPLQKMGMSGPPKPDVLVFNTNQCRDVKDWFQWYARQMDVPCVGIHTPRSIGSTVDERWWRTSPSRPRPWSNRWSRWRASGSTSTGCARRCGLSKQLTLLWKQVLETAANARRR